ncbi:MAG: hypothetical protein N3Z28_10115 [Synechococcaceae cyanobacterium MAG-AL2]|uniref:hypothetical protein n=1 Tax=Candidatus Regnicoccus frigidus TaxID=3074015 RepID=UPI0028280F8D|nr:hypothetical protein [Candidatus Regnicoccus frigidus]MCT4368008.1 hypothetical protein [Candidatus Regnicoccus frigidus MAG-AL2]
MALDAQLQGVLDDAWGRFSAYVDERLTKEITEPKWPWPNGESPRDIVDTGDLRASQSMTVASQPGTLETKYRWSAPYAPTVHDGAVFKATDAEGNARTMTARPWTREVIRDRVRLQTAFKLHFTMAAKRRAGRLGGTP